MHEGSAVDRATLMRASGLDPRDPTALLETRVRAALRGDAARPAREAAESLLADAGRLRGGARLHLALDMPCGIPAPGPFLVEARTAGSAWSAVPAPRGPSPEGCRRVRLALRASPLLIDWFPSLLARCRGESRAVVLRGGTPIEPCLSHDPDLPDRIAPGAIRALRGAGLDPGRLAWSCDPLPASALAALAHACGPVIAAAPPGDGAACLAAAPGARPILLGDRETLSRGRATDAPIRLFLALGDRIDRRLFLTPAGLAALGKGKGAPQDGASDPPTGDGGILPPRP